MRTFSTNIWNWAQPGRPSRAVAIVLMHVAAAWLPVMLSAADAQTGDSAGTAASADVAPKMADPPDAKRLSAEHDIWIDVKRKQVIIDGEICLRSGQLEMFACLTGTKEHESIVTLNTQAFLAHAALLRLGVEPGTPATYQPEYVPASGPEVDVTVHWIDKEGKPQEAKAQEWIRDVKTEKAMTHKWVFAGSGFWTDPSTGMEHYQAEGGDFICVSNFPSAMLDLPVESTQTNEGLLFEAFTDRIPPLRTKVRIVLEPVASKPEAESEKP